MEHWMELSWVMMMEKPMDQLMELTMDDCLDWRREQNWVQHWAVLLVQMWVHQ